MYNIHVFKNLIRYENEIYICISWFSKVCWFPLKRCWCHQKSRGFSRDSYIFWTFQVFIFDLNSLSDVLPFSSLGIYLHTLEPTRAAVSIKYLTVRMFRESNLSSFLRRYRDSTMSKTWFMISGTSFILTLNISISNLCKLQSWILKEPSCARSSSNVEFMVLIYNS